MLIIVGIPLFFYLLVIWFFAIHAIVIEGKGPISALGRSRELTVGSWWRLFGIGIVFILLLIPLQIVSNLMPHAIVSTVISALALPIFYVGGTLVYVDLRVRKENYDIQALADDLALGT